MLHSRRLAATLLATTMVLAACGGDDKPATPAAGAPTGSAGSPADDAPGEGDNAVGTGTAVVDGTTYVFDFVDVEAPADVGFGVVDRCDGDFMGMGMTAIGYLVDEDGLVALTDDGRPAGTLSVDVPAKGQDGLADAINVDLLGPELQLFLPNGGPGLTLDGTTASGTVTLQYDGQPYEVTIEVSCPA